MLLISAKFDSRAAMKGLSEAAKDQIPFATAKALTVLAQQARDRIKGELPQEFTIRRPWTIGGIRMDSAKKSDWPRCFSKVGSIDPYMVDFEEGGAHQLEGTRKSGPRAGKGTTAFVVPEAMRAVAGLAKDQVIPQRYWPSRVKPSPARRSRNGRKLKPKPFFMRMPGNRVGIFVRSGQFEQIGAHKREKLTLLWSIRDRPSKAPKKQWLRRPVQDIVTKNLQREFYVALRQAMASRR